MPTPQDGARLFGRSRAASRARRWARRALAAGLALLVAIGVSGWLAAPASALATVLVASEPQSEQTLDEAPGWVTVAFDGDVDSAAAKMIVQGPDGENVTTGTLIVEGTNVTSQLRDDLPQGTYTVHYRINRGESDVQGGAFQFAYGTGSFGKLPDRKWTGTANEPGILRGTDPNATSDAPDSGSAPPDVEVEKSDGKVETPDPGPTTTAPATKTDTPEDPTGGETASDEPTEGSPSDSATPTATTDSPSKLPIVIGGAALLIAIGAGAVALGLRRRGGNAAGGGSGPDGPDGSGSPGDDHSSGADGGSSGLTG